MTLACDVAYKQVKFFTTELPEGEEAVAVGLDSTGAASGGGGGTMADRRKREHEAEKELIKRAKDAEEAERAR